jgi:hypothetical protein
VLFLCLFKAIKLRDCLAAFACAARFPKSAQLPKFSYIRLPKIKKTLI